MEIKKYPLWVGIGIICLGLALLGLNFLPGWTNRAVPAVVFIWLAVLFIFILYKAPKSWSWRAWLMMPTAAFVAMGIIFTIIAVTNDWQAWAYAWLLIIAGLGVGLAYAARMTNRSQLLYKIGIWSALGGVVLCPAFGIIAHGPFMSVFSVILLVSMGVLIVLWATRRIDFSDLGWEFPSAKPESGRIQVGDNFNSILVEPLSKREIEVLQWIDQGLSNAEIANRMVVANSTVKTHINNIYTKLGVQSRTQAVRRAKDLGLL